MMANQQKNVMNSGMDPVPLSMNAMVMTEAAASSASHMYVPSIRRLSENHLCSSHPIRSAGRLHIIDPVRLPRTSGQPSVTGCSQSTMK